MTGKGRDKAAFFSWLRVVLTTCLDRGIGAFATRFEWGHRHLCQVDTGQLKMAGPCSPVTLTDLVEPTQYPHEEQDGNWNS